MIRTPIFGVGALEFLRRYVKKLEEFNFLKEENRSLQERVLTISNCLSRRGGIDPQSHQSVFLDSFLSCSLQIRYFGNQCYSERNKHNQIYSGIIHIPTPSGLLILSPAGAKIRGLTGELEGAAGEQDPGDMKHNLRRSRLRLPACHTRSACSPEK